MPSVDSQGKRCCRAVGVLEDDVGAEFLLDAVIGLENRQAAVAGEDEIAVFVKADIGVGAELLLQAAEQVQRELRQADVFRHRELLADRGAGQRGGRMGEMRVALDERDRAGKAVLAQIIGDRTADDCPADDDDIVSRHVVPFLDCR